MATEQDQIADLERRAAHLCSLLPFARRAFVLELAGTPKAGKTTSVEAIRHFFSRNGFRVHLLTERAATCPIPMKGHLFFNAWCMASMLAELLANVETETDIIIVDRGLFDALVWFTAQRERGELTADEAGKIEQFALLGRWTDLLDLAVVMNVDAEEALRRERSQRIATRDGSIMNQETLQRIHSAVTHAVTKYRSEFKQIIEHKSVGGVRESCVELISQILNSIDQFLDPNILVVRKTQIDEFVGGELACFSQKRIFELRNFLAKNGQFMKRSQAEVDDSMVQIVASTALCYGSKVFKFDRKEKDPKSNLYGKSAIWQGCHVAERKDAVINQIVEAGMERVNESLFLGRNFDLTPAGYTWNAGERHFGFCLRLNVENAHTAIDLRKKEFKKSRGFGLSGELVEWEELKTDPDKFYLEPWSVAIATNYKAFLGLKSAL